MAETIDYKKRCEEYEKRMGIGEFDPAKEGYLVLVKLLNQQNEYLNSFTLKGKISSDDKAVMTEYKNAKDLWENLSEMIKKVSSLRVELKIDGEEKRNVYVPVSAKSIADGINV